MRIKIVKFKARNAVNIGNIDKFRNEAVGDFKLVGVGHDLFRGSLSIMYVFFIVKTEFRMNTRWIIIHVLVITVG